MDDSFDGAVLAESFRKAAELIANSEALVIAAGAGMIADSERPGFLTPQEIWKAYSERQSSRLQFSDIAGPAAFARDPYLAWGVYGQCLNLYREAQPHVEFALLRMVGARAKHGTFVYTSNVDGAFQKAGFAGNRVVECHGSIHCFQCTSNCIDGIWSADKFFPVVDVQQCRLISKVPLCPRCGAVARPNILMLNDWEWRSILPEMQEERLYDWVNEIERPTVIEIGADDAIPTVRNFAESLDGPIIRISPEISADYDSSIIKVQASALTGMQGISRVLLEEIWDGEIEV
ncbi:MAG: NAD-dependent deacetylase [Gammaproteobacteria bacterium]|nr:NAD-dependent deacetylase [Gammaproteobacteria bacterium]